MRAGRLVTIGLTLLVAGCGAPSTDPSPAPGDGDGTAPPVTATGQGSGVLVTLALSTGSIEGGERVRIRVSALNAGIDEVTYEAGGCGLVGAISVSGDNLEGGRVGDPPPPAGDPLGMLGLARWSALSQGGPGLDTVRPPDIPDDGAMACPANLELGVLGPGQTVGAEAVWIARTMDGAPAAPGAYTVGFRFPFLGRGRVEPGMEAPPAPPVGATAPLQVVGVSGPAIDAGAAIDAAIADAEVRAWAARTLTRDGLDGAEVTFADGRWRWRIHSAGTASEIVVDAMTGAIIERRLEG